MQEFKRSEDSAIEQSTYAVIVTFKDEDGELVVPDSITWTLTDEDGNIINDKEDESETPASSITIVLSGDDLAFQAGETADAVWRILTIEGTYTSTLGSGLPIKDRLKFPVLNLVAVS